MIDTVTLPLWLVLVFGLLGVWALLDRLLMPSVRWYMRRSTNRVINEVNQRLKIEIPSFQHTKRQVLIDRLMYDPLVQEAAETHARTHTIPRDVVTDMVRRYAHEIVPAFNAYIYFRVGYWLARQVAQRLYRVRVGHVDHAVLGNIPSSATVVFVMNHRSNMDYILVAYLAAEQTALSYAVGEWARIWPLQMLIRAMGAYFVRRHTRDALYRRVLERYVAMATAAGVPQAIYPEGGLSRDGRLREPKLGLLDYMLRGFNPDERDLVFVPVGINYDRTLEDRTLLLERTPDTAKQSKRRAAVTTLRFVLHNLRLILRSDWYRFGYACVNFGTPISLRAYLAKHQIDLSTLSREERFTQVQTLGKALMTAVGTVVPVLPVSLVATVLVHNRDKPLSALELKARVYSLIGTLETCGTHVYIPRRDQDYAVTVGVRALTLRHIIEERDGLLSVQTSELPILLYYANAIAHHLGSEICVDQLTAARR